MEHGDAAQHLDGGVDADDERRAVGQVGEARPTEAVPAPQGEDRERVPDAGPFNHNPR